ncbi:tRNA pseudouridine(13) synthase TruD [Paludisphaera mucosa]|uniref:tRNA pseudouridine(13) synthase TruD n=1 Tax=Paludisphaera mucosa TaxID=3030827 RepID=A0ABT6FFF3_9BACT|nr:tRNA pseudouridine(13) synthase TruD [Paludisphaera mucosa]MDG3006294.1 tRNA pseudouridine(13) synthase TruD [Paludisphaera mucosa]
MKLKRQPEDFQVEELPIVAATDRGRYTFYRLSKTDLGTIEAVEAICRRWNIPGGRVAYGGLKDRHAVTVQYLTIFDGPAHAIHQPNLDLEPLGKLERAYGPQDFSGNRFVVVLRDMTAGAAAEAGRQLVAASNDGVPNYFDDQRFGSVGYSGEFIAHAWLQGDYEKALRLALAEPNAFDRSETKARKAALRTHWGNWPEAKAALDRSSERSLVTYLVDHPTDFAGAFSRHKRELRGLYFSAFQSWLWNLILAGWIERNTTPEQRVLVDLKVGALPFPVGLDPDQRRLIDEAELLLPSSRTPLPDGPLGEIAADVLAAFGLTWADMRVKKLKDVFFSKGSRRALIPLDDVRSEVLDDSFERGKKAVRLEFTLPKGAYATMLVKRLTEAVGADA